MLNLNRNQKEKGDFESLLSITSVRDHMIQVTHDEEFQKVYGIGPYMQDMRSAGCYPSPDEESLRGFWPRLTLTAGAGLDVTPRHQTLLAAPAERKLFLLSTNADHRFEKEGLPLEQFFAIQGSCNLIQCQCGCHQKPHNAIALYQQMDVPKEDGRISSEMVSQCLVCGSPLALNLCTDSHWISDAAFETEEFEERRCA